MSPLLLHLAAHHTVPVILQHRSGQGAKRKRGWELGRTKKCFRSGGACHEGRWRHVGVVSRWAPSSLQFMPWAGDRGTEQGQVSSHFMECFCPDKSLYKPHSRYIHFQMWKSLQKRQPNKRKTSNKTKTGGILSPVQEVFEVLCLKQSQGELFDLGKVFSSSVGKRLGKMWCFHSERFLRGG